MKVLIYTPVKLGFLNFPSFPSFRIFCIAQNENREVSEVFHYLKPFIFKSRKSLPQNLCLNSCKTQVNQFSSTIIPRDFYCFLLKKSLTRFNCLLIFPLQDTVGLLLTGVSKFFVLSVFCNCFYTSGNQERSDIFESLKILKFYHQVFNGST